MSKWILENIFVIHPKNSCDSRAPLSFPRRRGGSTPFPHSSLLCDRRIMGSVLNSPSGGRLRARFFIINASAAAAVLCCIAVPHRGWVGWCVNGLLGRWVDGWVRLVGQYVDGRVCSLLWVMCFVLIFVAFWTHHGGLTALSLDLYYCSIRRLLYLCCNTLWVGGSLRGRHCCTTFCCTAESGWVARFVAVTMLCVPPVVCPPLRGLFVSFSFSPAVPAPRWHSSAYH